MTDKLMPTVAGIGTRLAAATGKSPAFHTRQTREFLRIKALVPTAYAGEGRTAAAVFDEAGVCRAMILYTLASLGLDFSLLEVTNRIRLASGATHNLDPRARNRNKAEPSDAVA